MDRTPLCLAMAVSRTTSIGPTWTTLHLARAALARGHTVAFVDPTDFRIATDGRCLARTHTLDPPGASAEALVEQLVGRTARRSVLDLRDVDVLLLRAGRLDSRMLTFAQLARDAGATVINDPAGAMLVSHKAWIAAQAGVPRPLTVVTPQVGTAELFADNHRFVIIKPARARGGAGVHRVDTSDRGSFRAAFRGASALGDGYVVVQALAPRAEEGEVRLVWFDGEVLGAYIRHAAEGEFRHNLARGGTAVAATVTEAQQLAADALSPALLRSGVRLAGIDVIGDLVIEVNALNPGGLFHADRLNGSSLADAIVARLESDAPCIQSASR